MKTGFQFSFRSRLPDICTVINKQKTMKKIFTKFLVLLALMLPAGIKAQTTIDIVQLVDSTTWGSALCSTPVSVLYTVDALVSGYNPATDSIDIHLFWDDGSDTLFRTNINSSAFGDYVWTNGVPHIYNSAGIYDIMVVATGPDGNDDTLINPPITVTSGCTNIDGYAYIDNNGNCTFDAGDDTLAGIGIEITDASGNPIGYGYSNASGYYSTSIITGLSGVQIAGSSYYYYTSLLTATCPASGSYTFNSTGTPLSFNFGFSCAGSFDLYAYHSFSGVGAPGSNGMIGLVASSSSCSAVPATITLTLDPDVSYAGMISGPAPSSVAGNVLTWNMVMPASPYYYAFTPQINISTSTSAVLMDTAFFDVTITPTSGDVYPANNSNSWYLLIGGPYDPNSKQVEPAGNIAPAQELTYTVNFQNTGTAPALNVYVMDTISSNLDMSSFHMVASSHAMTPYFYEGNIVRFDYPGINLPDSSSNEPLSHGWVIYKVKPKTGLANGTQIDNTAHIYFDYNPAIVTNTTVSTIDMSMGVTERDAEISSMIYPNPASDRITIEFGEETSGVLLLVDMTGKVVKTKMLSKDKKAEIGLEGLSSGLYGISLPGVQLKQNRIQVIR
jgi:uncharacterized repeat protein (TIGR01451 family)